VACIVGYGASQEVLDRAGVSRADIVVAVSNHDEVNLIAALAAKQLGAKRAVARAQGDEWANWTEGMRYGLLGVDVVINPRVLVAQELARVARSHGAERRHRPVAGPRGARADRAAGRVAPLQQGAQEHRPAHQRAGGRHRAQTVCWRCRAATMSSCRATGST
jgi:trk system potassium uptake protein TrkA